MSSEPPKVAEEVRFENFVDFFKIAYRRGMFMMEFGQTIRQPPTPMVRLWTDAPSAKVFADLLQKMIKEYEDKVGKI